MLDACIEHLGGLPSQLNLSDDQVRELLAYHRIKAKSQSVCQKCSEESRNRERTCFMCGGSYTDKGGVVRHKTEQPDGEFVSALKAMALQKQAMAANRGQAGGEKVVTRQNFADRKSELEAAWRKQCAERGITIVE